jgi:hypothetical protein
MLLLLQVVLRKLLAAEGCDVMLLPIVLGSGGTLLECLDRATKVWTFPMLEKETIRRAPPTQYVQSTNPRVPTAIPANAKANRRSKGKIKMQIASFPTPICPMGQAGKPAYPFMPNGFLFLHFVGF